MAQVLREEWAGFIVDILDFAGTVHSQHGEIFENVWFVSKRGETIYEGMPAGIPDEWLLPIRPGDLQEQDETVKELTV